MKAVPSLTLLSLLLLLLVACAPRRGVSVDAPEPTLEAPTATLGEPFDVPVTDPVSEPEPEPEMEGAALCPDVPRPALALFVPGEAYVFTNPTAGSSCQTTLAGDMPGLFQVAGDGIYYAVRIDASGEAGPGASDNFAVKEVRPDGSASVLPFTTVPYEQARLGYRLAVSEDQRLIAWSAGYAADLERAASRLWLAAMATGDVWTPLPEATLQRSDAADHYRRYCQMLWIATSEVASTGSLTTASDGKSGRMRVLPSGNLTPT